MPGARLLLIGDETTGTAAVVDTQRDTARYLAFAAEHSLKIEPAFLTQFHADFIAWGLNETQGYARVSLLSLALR